MDRGHGRVVRGALILAAAVLAAAIAPESMAQFRDPLPWRPEALATVVPDPRVAALVDELDADDHATRARATAALLDPAVPEDQVWLALSRGGLSAEAHRRLLAVGRSRIVDAPRGALGIQMAGRFADADGVTVTALIPNMPARKHLQPGDRIVAIDGRPVRVSQELTAIVQMKRPGEPVDVVVMRGERDAQGRVKAGPDGRPAEERIEVRMEVGSRDDLERFGDGGMSAPVADLARERMADELAASFPMPVRTLPSSRVEGEPLDVEAHPDIVQLRAQLARPDGLGPGVGVRAVLRARLAQLEAASRAPGLDPSERAWFRAVAERYRELIPEDLRPEAEAAPRRP
jgi:hypothetical protein